MVLFFSMMACEKTDRPEEKSVNPIANEKAALPQTKQYDGQIAHRWFRLLTDISRTTPLPPPPSLRLFAYSGLAFYEAVLPGMPSNRSFFAQRTGIVIDIEKKKDYVWPLAANAAIARTASRILGNYSSSPNLSAIQTLEAQIRQEFAAVGSAEDQERSIAFGVNVGDLIYAWSTEDGTLTAAGTLAPCPPYVPLGGPGNWVPTPPGFAPGAGACQGSLRTFLPNARENSLPEAPPVYSTDPGSDYYQQFQDVVDRTAARTPDDATLCQSWRDLVGTNYNTPAHVLNLTTGILEKETFPLDAAALIYVKQVTAMYDAVVSVFYAKYYYSMQRPITYIRGVMNNSSWNSLYPTIPHPAYPSTMSGVAAAGFTILAKHIGEDYAFTDSTLSSLYGRRNYLSFDEIISDVGRTRLLSGHNYQAAIDAGILQGQLIAHLTDDLRWYR
jgi:hypothetical protein